MKNKLYIAAIGDMHVGKHPISETIFQSISQKADILLIVGDLTHRGLPEQLKECLKLLKNISIPLVAVLGNHDYDGDKDTEIVQLLEKNRVRVLQGDVTTYTIQGITIGITGTKGHGGGFAPHRGVIRGEKSTKMYMQEEEEETRKLRKGLKKLQKMELDVRIALLHYAPYRETIVGEPPELSLFLGSSRFADELRQYPVDLVVHGHAHHGTGRLIKTREGIFACNVARMLHQEQYALFSIEKAFGKEQKHVHLLTG